MPVQNYTTGNRKLDEKIQLALIKDPTRSNRLQRLESELAAFREKHPRITVSAKEDRTDKHGELFASAGELRRWYQLIDFQKAGYIQDLKKQVPFELQESFINRQHGDIEAITYVADFTYINILLHKEWQNRLIVEDYKGKYKQGKTDVYKLKRKMFLYKYGDLIFIES